MASLKSFTGKAKVLIKPIVCAEYIFTPADS